MSPRQVVAGVIVLLGVLPYGADARAADLPAWAQPIAAQAPTLPDGVPKHEARVLLSDCALTVAADGTFRVRERLAVQALKARAEGVGVGGFAFQEGASIRTAKGWHLPPEGKAVKSKSPEIDFSLDDAFVTDARVRVVSVDGVRKGSLVFFEFEAEFRPHLLSYRQVFIEAGPIDRARFSVEVPEGWEIRRTWLRGDGAVESTATSRIDWTLADLPAPEEEPWGESALEQVPVLVLGFVPPPGSPLEGKSARDWGAFAAWFERLAAGTDDSNDAIRAAARTACEGAGTDATEKVGALTRLVRDRVRYIAQGIGIGGYRPRPAVETLSSLYGDCKDKGTLLRAMLAAEGIVSHPILVDASHDGQIGAEVPDLGAFDHLVVGVVLPDGAEVPASLSPALVRVEGLGRLLVVDPTHEYLEPGGVPAYLAGKRGLVVAGEKSRLFDLPVGSPEAHRVERRLTVEFVDGDRVSFRLRSSYHGESAVEPTARYRQSSAERRRAVEDGVAQRWIGAVVEEYRAEVGGEVPFAEEVAWQVPSLPGGWLDSVFPEVCGEIPRVSIQRRKGPVVLRHPRGVAYQTEIRGLPEDIVLPQSGRKDGPGWSIETAFDGGDGTLRGQLALEIERLRFDADAFGDLKDLWTACSRAASVKVAKEP